MGLSTSSQLVAVLSLENLLKYALVRSNLWGIGSFLCFKSYHMHAVHLEARRVYQIITDSCELLWGCWESNLGLLDEWQMLLATGPSLQTWGMGLNGSKYAGSTPNFLFPVYQHNVYSCHMFMLP